MVLAGLLLLLGLQQTPAGTARTPPADQVVAVHTLFQAPGGALVWLERSDGDHLRSAGIEPYFSPIELERYREPLGDGVWVEMLSARMRPLGAFRAALPPPGSRCGLELPVVRGTWWLLVLERRGGDTRVLAQLQVGPDLARLAEKYPIPVQ